MLYFDRRAIPGIVFGALGAAICYNIWGWHEAIIWFLAAGLGSTRFN